MSNTIKIHIPIFDDPLYGRIIGNIPIAEFHDHIIIEEGVLKRMSFMETRPKCIYQIKESKKFLLIKYIDPTLKPKSIGTWNKAGFEAKLMLIDLNGKTHNLIEPFSYGKLREPWHRFIEKLCDATGLPIEERDEELKD